MTPSSFVVAVTVIASSSSLFCRRRVVAASSSLAFSSSFAFMHRPASFHSSSWKRTPSRQPQQRISSPDDARRHYHATIMLHLNRVLFHISEIDTANNGNDIGVEDDDDLHGMKEDDDGTRRSKGSIDTVRSKKKLPTTSRSDNANYLATVTLPRDDYRTIHVAKILKLHNGDTLRVGVVRHRRRTKHYHNHHNIHHSANSKVTNIANRYNGNDDSNNLAGLLTDNATIAWIPEGKNKLAQPTKNGDPPGSLCITIPHPIMTQSSTSSTTASSSSMIIKNQIISTRLDDNDEENISATTMFNDHDDTTTNDDDHNIDDVDVPRVSLLLALPRPLQLRRLLPMVAQMGVEHIVLTNANKVPKDYFGCRILRNNNNNNNNNDNNNNSDDDDDNKDDNMALQNLLIEGLSICGNDVTLPTVTITKRLRTLLANGGELDRLFPRELYARVIAHPTRLLPLVDDDGTSSRSNIDDDDDDDGTSSDVERIPIVTTRRMADVVFPINTQRQQRQPKRMLVAVGPEGGWEEPYELIMFANAGFQQVSLGARVLRSDVAVVSLLALANDVCYS